MPLCISIPVQIYLLNPTFIAHSRLIQGLIIISVCDKINFTFYGTMPRKDKHISRARKSGRKTKSVTAKSHAAAPMPSANGGPAPAAVLTSERLQQLYSSMLKCRILQNRVQEVSVPVQPSLQKNSAGREAVLVGALAHARLQDSITAAENILLASFLHGNSLNTLLTQLASTTANTAPDSKKTPPPQFALARAMDQAREMFNSGRIALVFCGEDPAALAFQTEALAQAAKYKSPVVCLIETSLSSLATAPDPQRTQTRRSPQHHFPQIVVDGADVVAIFRVTQEAIRRARTGHGPSLIKCVIPDSAVAQGQNGRPEIAHDPLTFMEQYLRRRNLWLAEGQRKIADDFTAELDAALAPREQPSHALR